MSNKLNRRELMQATAAGAAGLAAGCAGGNAALAGAPCAGCSHAFGCRPIRRTHYLALVRSTPTDRRLAPNVTVEVVSVSGIDHQEVATKILASLAAGSPVDIGFACTEATQLYAGEGLAAAA